MSLLPLAVSYFWDSFSSSGIYSGRISPPRIAVSIDRFLLERLLLFNHSPAALRRSLPLSPRQSALLSRKNRNHCHVSWGIWSKNNKLNTVINRIKIQTIINITINRKSPDEFENIESQYSSAFPLLTKSIDTIKNIHDKRNKKGMSTKPKIGDRAIIKIIINNAIILNIIQTVRIFLNNFQYLLKRIIYVSINRCMAFMILQSAFIEFEYNSNLMVIVYLRIHDWHSLMFRSHFSSVFPEWPRFSTKRPRRTTSQRNWPLQHVWRLSSKWHAFLWM